MSEIIQTYSEIVRAYLEINIALAPLISIFLRTASVVIAPIPGTPIDLLNLAFFSKMAGFIYAEISIMLGSCINFWISRRFGESTIKNFVPIEKIHIWEERIKEKSGFWGLVFVRMGTILIFDYLSYVAGLTKMSFQKFFSSSLLASIPPMAAFYYFGGLIVGTELFITLILLVPLVTLFSLFKRRKIFKGFYDYIDIKANIEKINDLINRKPKI